MGLGIFVISSWDVIEPLTFIAQAFWLMVGSKIYLWKSVDMDISAYDQLYEQEVEALMKSSDFDTEKEAFLESYLVELRKYEEYLGSEAGEGHAE